MTHRLHPSSSPTRELALGPSTALPNTPNPLAYCLYISPKSLFCSEHNSSGQQGSLVAHNHTNISFVILSTLLLRFFCFQKLALHSKGKLNYTNTSICEQKQLSPFSSSPSRGEHRSPTGSDENFLYSLVIFSNKNRNL